MLVLQFTIEYTPSQNVAWALRNPRMQRLGGPFRLLPWNRLCRF